MDLDSIQSKWDAAAAPNVCCYYLCFDGSDGGSDEEACPLCMASTIRKFFGIDEWPDPGCAELYGRGPYRNSYGRFIRRHISWLAGHEGEL